MTKLHWGTWVLFIMVTIVALAISWWSMFTLGVDVFNMPTILAGSVSAAFDLGAIYLALIAINYAKSDESGFTVSLFTYGFAALSAWINWQHAELLNYGIVGIVFFAAAPIMSAVLLKVTLDYLNKKNLVENGRTVRNLPTAGLLTWFVYPLKAFSLTKEALRLRMQNALVRHIITEELEPEDVEIAYEKRQALENFDRKRPLKVAATLGKAPTAEKISEKSISQQVDEVFSSEKAVEKSSQSVSHYPSYLEKGMSANRIAALCFENGISDLDTIFSYARMVNEDVKRDTVSKSLSRARSNSVR